MRTDRSGRIRAGIRARKRSPRGGWPRLQLAAHALECGHVDSAATLLPTHREHSGRGKTRHDVREGNRVSKVTSPPAAPPAGAALILPKEEAAAAREVGRLVLKVELERQMWRELFQNPPEAEILRKSFEARETARETAKRSADEASRSRGCCTLTATTRPLARSTARCTCASDADATGAGSNEEKSVERGAELLFDQRHDRFGRRDRIVLKERGERHGEWCGHQVVELRHVLAQLDVHAAVGHA